MTTLDWSVLVLYFVAIAGLGVWLSRGQKDSTDFLLGARAIPWWAALLSLVATEISAATFLGAPEQGYRRDLTFLQLWIGFIAARFVLAHWFIGAYYRAGVTTVYEFLGTRFGPLTQKVTAGLFLFGRLFADGSRLFIAAITVNVVTELPMSVSIVGLALVTVAYTSAGGIKAVIWTDVMQAVVLVGSGLALAYSLLQDTGLSLGQISGQLQEAGKLKLFDFGGDVVSNPFNGVTAIVGGFFLTLATHGTDHDMVQRLLTCRTDAGSRRSMWLSGLIGVVVTTLFMGIGLLLFVFLSQAAPDSKLALKAAALAQEGKNGHFLLHYALASLPAGMVGLIVAGILAAAMSSLSSALNAMTATFVSDFYWHFRPHASGAEDLKLSRLVNFTIGLLIMGLALFIRDYSRDHPNADLLSLALGVMTFFYGGLLGIFLVALFSRTRGNDRSNLMAAIGSTLVVFAVARYELVAWPWFVVIGTAVSSLISLTGRTPGLAEMADNDQPV